MLLRIGMIGYTMFHGDSIPFEKESNMSLIVGAIYVIIGFSFTRTKNSDKLPIIVMIFSMIMFFFTLYIFLTNLKNDKDVMLIWKLSIAGIIIFAILYYLEDMINVRLIYIFTILFGGFAILLSIRYTLIAIHHRVKELKASID